MNDKYIWLFAENEAKTMNNNSFYFWKYIVLNQEKVNAFFVVEKIKEI